MIMIWVLVITLIYSLLAILIQGYLCTVGPYIVRGALKQNGTILLLVNFSDINVVPTTSETQIV
jgi:hypothetical protein